MTMAFDDILAGDAPAFLGTFGEKQQAIYLPGATSSNPGPPRPITVIVERGAPELIKPGQKGATNSLTIRVANDHVLGITSTEFDSGVDKIQIAADFGDPLPDASQARRFSTDKLRQDGGMLTFKVM